MSATTAEPKRGAAATAASRRLRREVLLTVVAGALALGVYAVVQLLLLEGPRPYDPSKYFATAVEFPHVPRDLFTQRIGLVAPVRLAVLAFGPSEASLYAVPIASGLLLAAAVYATMLVLFGDRLAAALAALVTVLNPSYLVNSSFIFPDTTAAATFSAGILCLILGAGRAGAVAGRRANVAAACAGVLFGWTYLVREFSPVLLPVVVVAIVLLRYPPRRAALVAAAACATAALELVYGLVRYGDPLAHLHDLLQRGGQVPVQGELDSVLDVLLALPRVLLTWRAGWAFVLLLLVFLVAAAVLHDRRLWLLAGWCFGFWAFMTAVGLASLPSGRWILNVSSIRYWYPLFPPLVMGAFGGTLLLARAWMPSSLGTGIRRLAGPVVAGAAVVVLVPGIAEFRHCAALDVWPNDPQERWHELRSWFATPEAQRYDVLWTDEKTGRLVPAYASTTFGRRLWSGRVEAFPDAGRRVVPPQDRPRSLVLVHKDRLRPGAADEAWLDRLRAGWSPLFVTSDGRMVALAAAPAGGTLVSAGDWWRLPSPERPKPGHCGARPGGKG